MSWRKVHYRGLRDMNSCLVMTTVIPKIPLSVFPPFWHVSYTLHYGPHNFYSLHCARFLVWPIILINLLILTFPHLNVFSLALPNLIYGYHENNDPFISLAPWYSDTGDWYRWHQKTTHLCFFRSGNDQMYMGIKLDAHWILVVCCLWFYICFFSSLRTFSCFCFLARWPPNRLNLKKSLESMHIIYDVPYSYI